jgi:hypothetical protein
MKKWMWSILVIIFVVGVVVSVMAFKSSDIETPKYTVIQTINDVEIREYPSLVVAKTPLNSASFDQAGNQGFRSIAGYIFGGNETQEKIAMTAPVVMNMGDSAWMYFVMPSAYAKNALPKPSASNVRIVEEASKVLAVLRYGGFSSDHKIKKHCETLGKTLQESGLQTVGDYLYMGYNAPWDVVNRRNEVAIEINPNSLAIAR